MSKTRKVLTILVFGIAAVLSVIFMRNVVINYNLSDYLGEDTETKVALEIIENEFGLTGDIQVMVENIDQEKAKEIKKTIENIDNVINVNFDVNDESYYLNNNALYVVLVDGDDYSENAKNVAKEIKESLKSYESVQYGGTTIEKQKLQDAITNEMVYIIAIAICLAVIILLITSESWIEPFVLLFCSGIAILINRGTNIIFDNISYITNSISAILQLALSVDYSIVLLHTYKSKKKEYDNNDLAMKETIKSIARPVSASALTTIAGLLALLFMSFRIGFDIGIVLMKGIVISLITSLTLLPVITLFMDKLLTKSKKKMFVPHGKIFYNFSMKFNKVIVIVMIILTCSCAVIQTNNKFIFSDTKSGNEEIIKNFGSNNSVVVVYKNGNNNYSNEQKLIDKINDYGTVLSSYTAYTNTVREKYDLNKAVTKLEITEDEAKLMYAMYSLYDNEDTSKLSFKEFVKYANELIENDNDAQDFVNENTTNIIYNILTIDKIMNQEHSSSELYDLINSLKIDNKDLSKFSIEQMYGLYYYNSISNTKVDFITMLKFINSVSSDENLSNMFTDDIKNNLTSLEQGVEQFIQTVEKELTKEEFKGYMYSTYEVLLSDEQVSQIYQNYFLYNQEEEKETISFLKLLNFLVETNMITDETSLSTITNYNYLYNVIKNDYEYDQFLNTVSIVAYALTNQTISFEVNNDSIKQIYILYFRINNLITYGKIKGETFVNFVLEAAKASELINSQIAKTKDSLLDMVLVNKYLTNDATYSYIKMNEIMSDIQNSIHMQVEEQIDLDKISGIYIKYLVNEDKEYTKELMAYQLLDFINANKNTNSLLIKKLDNNKLTKIDDANKDLKKAENLFKSSNYSRMLLQINLPNESDETYDFVQFLSKEVKEIFGDEAYVAGEIVSTVDLRDTFDHDNTFITVFTLVSIFIIVMIIFKSLSLPLILVVLIQGAIFITMATQLMNEGIFFMSYIVVTCILMGATIDYGILMSSTYLESRKTEDKKEAIYTAIETAMPTIFTSGLILVICGFVIHFVSSQNSISTVGLLLGIGTISSVIMILVVLPSFLYLLDKFILKLTIYNKKEK